MTIETCLQIERVGRVARIRLHRPERLNALDSALVARLQDALTGIADDPAVGAVLLVGAGRTFCAGADLEELSGFEPVDFDRYIRRLEAVCMLLESLPQPTLCAIHGVAFGGGFELALACDLRFAERAARLGLPEVKLGLLPGAGGLQRAARLLPLPVVRRLALSGDPLDASLAHHYGLVELPESGSAEAAALALAEELAAGAPLAQAAAKRLLRRGAALDVQAAIELEQGSVTALFATTDRREGIQAFLEKRAPRFTGR